MMHLTKKFEFDAAHTLGDSLGEKESRVHGHRYTFRVTVAGTINKKIGAVMDLEIVKKVVNEIIIAQVDHHNLNEIIDNPTMENLVVWMWEKLHGKLEGLFEIELWETPNNSVRFRGE